MPGRLRIRKRQRENFIIVLWTPSDREPAPQYRERLTAVLHDIRGFYAKEMKRMGFGPRTLKFAHADDGLIAIHLVKGTNPYAHYKTQSGSEIRRECLGPLRAAGIDPDKETIVIFCNMSNWDPEKNPSSARTAPTTPAAPTATAPHGRWIRRSSTAHCRQERTDGPRRPIRAHLDRPIQLDLHRWRLPRTRPRDRHAAQPADPRGGRRLGHRPDGLRQPHLRRRPQKRGQGLLPHPRPRAAPRIPPDFFRIGEGDGSPRQCRLYRSCDPAETERGSPFPAR